jgi:hypothetical protein
MNSNDAFGQDLSTWLQEEGEHRVPDHLREVLVRTVATRRKQRRHFHGNTFKR